MQIYVPYFLHNTRADERLSAPHTAHLSGVLSIPLAVFSPVSLILEPVVVYYPLGVVTLFHFSALVISFFAQASVLCNFAPEFNASFMAQRLFLRTVLAETKQCITSFEPQQSEQPVYMFVRYLLEQCAADSQNAVNYCHCK